MNENRANFYAYKEKDGSWRIETPEGPVILDAKTKLKDAQNAAEFLRSKHQLKKQNAIAKN
jgi:hypothetical protein